MAGFDISCIEVLDSATALLVNYVFIYLFMFICLFNYKLGLFDS
jgi:hypothetical protein